MRHTAHEVSNEYREGQHKCKGHGYQHNYVQHTCDHEFCKYAWEYCPRCYGSGRENMLPGHPGYIAACLTMAWELEV